MFCRNSEQDTCVGNLILPTAQELELGQIMKMCQRGFLTQNRFTH